MKKISYLLYFTISLSSSISAQILPSKRILLQSPQSGTNNVVAQQSVTLKNGFKATGSTTSTFNAKIDEALSFGAEYLAKPVSTSDATTYSFNTEAPVSLAQGSVNVSPTGAATYHYPINIPAGIAGMEPNISIDYNSQGGDGLLGLGFNISGLSAIMRVPKTIFTDGVAGGVHFDMEDRFSLDGNRLMVLGSAVYGAVGAEYETEIQSFSRIVSSGGDANGPASFKVTTKDGKVLEYGVTGDSKVIPTGDSNTKPLAWLLNKVTDANGNYMTFKYKNNSSTGETVIEEILYTGNSGTGGITPQNSINFYYDIKTESRTSYVSGKSIASTMILRMIKCSIAGTKVRSYDFDYITKNSRSSLNKVTETLADGQVLNPTVFEWGLESTELKELPINIACDDIGLKNWTSGDYEFDGLADLLSTTKNTSGLKIMQLFSCGLDGQGGVQFSLKKEFDSYKIMINANTTQWCIEDPFFIKTRADKVSQFFLPYSAKWVDPGYNNPQTGVYNEPKLNAESGFIYRNIRDGAYPRVVTHCSTSLATTQMPLFAHSDLNNDGSDDWFILETEKWDTNGFKLCTHQLTPIGTFIYSHKEKYLNLNGDTPIKLLVQDFDNDGLKDLFVLCKTGYSIIRNIGIKLHSVPYEDYTLAWAELLEMPFQTGISCSSSSQIDAGDFNGDGLLDIVYTDSNGNLQFAINNGTLGFTINPLAQPAGELHENVDFFVFDFNFDGKSDLIQLEKQNYQFESVEDKIFNASNPNITPKRTSTAVENFLIWRQSSGDGKIFTSVKNRMVAKSFSISGTKVINDFNGDGRMDLISYGSNLLTGVLDGSMHFFTSFDVKFDSNLITSITDGIGNNTKISYQPITYTEDELGSTFYTKGNSAVSPIVDYQAPLYCVKSVSTSDGIGGTSTTKYSYEEARMHKTGKGFLGFKKQTSINSAIDKKIVTTTTLDDESCMLKSQIIDESTATGTPLSQTINTFEVKGPSYSTRKTAVLVKSEFSNLLTNLKTTTTNSYDDVLNLTTSVIDINGTVVQSTSNSNFVIVGTSKDASRPQDVSVTKKHPDDVDFTSSVKYAYDSKGNVIHETKNPGIVGKEVNIDYLAYDAWGVPKKITTTSNSEGGNLNMTEEQTLSIQNGIVTTTKFNADLGSTKTVTDLLSRRIVSTGVDGLTTTSTLDGLGRIVETQFPDGNRAYASVTFTGQSDPKKGIYYSLNNSTGRPWSKTYFDPFGRVVKEETVGINGLPIYSETVYNAKGQLIQKTAYADGVIVTQVTYSYNADGRVNTENYNDGKNISYQYSGLQVTTTVNGKSTITEYDILGNIKSVTEPSPGGTINYKYASCGKPKEIVAPTTTITMEYDALGNQIKLNDPDAGSQEYRYDALGRLTYQEDAKGVKTTLQYNSFGQLIHRETDSKKTSIDYLYYTTGVAKGRAKEIKNKGVTVESYVYDNLGRLIKTTKAIDGLGSIDSQNGYDRYGNVNKIIYPGGYEIFRQFDDYGNVIKLKSSTSDIWTLNTQDATKLKYTYGNHLVTEKTFNSLGQLSAIKTQNATGDKVIQDISYYYDEITGLMGAKWEKRPNALLREMYQYDDLERLTSWQTFKGADYASSVETGSYSIGYVKDKVVAKSDIGTYFYNKSQPHAVSSVVSSGIVGFTPKSTDIHQLVYAENGKVSKLTENSNILEITYGIDDEREKSVLTQNGTITCTTYFAGQYEVQKSVDPITKVLTKKEYLYIQAGDGLVAVLVKTNDNAGELLYIHKDHLGSITAITDANGAIKEEMNYDPWGRRRNPSDWSFNNVTTPTLLARGYTGHEHLDVFSLINMNGRVYDPLLGVFLTPDNNIQAPTSTQNYNRYSYCMGNPLKYKDPSGQFLEYVAAAAFFYFRGAHNNRNKVTGNWEWNPIKWGGTNEDGSPKEGFNLGTTISGDGRASYNVGYGGMSVGYDGQYGWGGGTSNGVNNNVVYPNYNSDKSVQAALDSYNYARGAMARDAQSEVASRSIGHILISPAGQGGFDDIPLNPSVGMGERIVGIANGYVGSTDYNLLSKQGDFLPGNPKCNKFVYDVLLQAGASSGLPNQPGRWGMPGPKPPIAAQWANANYNIPGWVVVSSPMPGDVASFSGHVGIVFGNGLTISATLRDGVVRNDWGFRTGQTPVFRRFVGYSPYY